MALDVWFGLANLAQVGRNLLDDATWERVRALRDSGELVFVMYDNSRLTLKGASSRSLLRLVMMEKLSCECRFTCSTVTSRLRAMSSLRFHCETEATVPVNLSFGTQCCSGAVGPV